MVININPERISSSAGGKLGERRKSSDDSAVLVPKRAHVNFVPPAESLQTLIRGAVEALRKGIRWDRGTILNLLV